MFVQSFIAAAFMGLVSAGMVHEVFVGGEGILKFTPEYITAAVGDQVRFTFSVKNHTVTQSSFDSPCSPLTDAHGMHNGFFSGYMPVTAADANNLPQFWIPVNDEKPIWAYCQQGNHCAQGMVFAVNPPSPPSEKSFENWKAKAMGGVSAVATATSSVAGGYDYYTASTTESYNAYPTTTDAAYSSQVSTHSAIEYPDLVTVTETVTVATATWTTVYGSYPGSANPTPAAEVQVHKVVVGGTAGNLFTPSSVQAKPRDIISFEFHAKNHTVTQSTFKTPCSKLDGGLDSGFQPAAVDATSFTSWNVTVADTAPLWFFCAQGNHCTSGMVFSVNPVETSEVNQDSFKSAAMALAQNAGTVPTSSGSAATATKTAVNAAVGKAGGFGASWLIAGVVGIMGMVLL